MNLRKLFKQTETKEDILRYLMEIGVIKNEKKYWKCKKLLYVNLNNLYYSHTSKKCVYKAKVLNSTLFQGKDDKLGDYVILCYFIIYKVKVKEIKTFLQFSRPTICARKNKIELLLAQAIPIETQKIGCSVIIVEIDETKLGKRKYHRGHRVEGVWVVGGVERTSEKRYFFVAVEDRTKETLENIIQSHVEEGSIVYTDGWKGYNHTSSINNLTHMTVNHSRNFVDPITGVHINTIDGMNNFLKMEILPRNRVKKNMEKRLIMTIWRRKNKHCLWYAFIETLKIVFD